MAAVKVVVLYPTPLDQGTYERAYTQDHVPMVSAQNFQGIQKFVASRIVGTPDGGAAPFFRVAELHFPSTAALQAAVQAPSAQKVVAHAVSISSGGAPIVLIAENVLIAEEETKTF